MVFVCPRCEVIPFGWKLAESSLNWNRLKTQTWAVTDVWLTHSTSISPSHWLCLWTPELLAHKTWFVHHTCTWVMMHSQYFLRDTGSGEPCVLPAPPMLSGTGQFFWMQPKGLTGLVLPNVLIIWWCVFMSLCADWAHCHCQPSWLANYSFNSSSMLKITQAEQKNCTRPGSSNFLNQLFQSEKVLDIFI